MHEVKGPGFVKFLYNHNPFYLISAAVILYGFHVSLEEASFATNPWFLASLFAGYATLLALTAWVIVRFGKVWDDARSIFMVLLLLFMALSASIDGLFVTNPATAITLATAGFVFAIVITESLVWSLGIRFRSLFRLPLYAMLATSFFFPYLFAMQESMWPELDRRFIILLFPLVVSLTILSLIPSIRKTKRYAAKNGTPWRWPLYPYSIFVLTIVGLVGRTVMLGLSFDPTPANGMLGTWMFVPIFLSVTWLLFEIGSAENDHELQFFSMLLMPVSMVLAVAWPLFSNTAFYDQIAMEIGSPVWLTLLAVVGMYLMAWLDGVENAGSFLVVSLIGSCLMQPSGDFVSEFTSVQTWPCLILAAWSVASFERIFRSNCWFLASCCVSIPLANSMTPWLANSFNGLSLLRGTEAIMAINFLMLFSCLIACVFSGQFAKQLKIMLALLLPTIAALVAVGSLLRPEHATLTAGYGCVLGVAGLAISLFAKSRLHLSSAAFSFGASVLAASPLLEFTVGQGNQRLARFIVVGMACFLIGVLVSAVKAGWMNKFNAGLDKLKQEFVDAFSLSLDEL